MAEPQFHSPYWPQTTAHVHELQMPAVPHDEVRQDDFGIFYALRWALALDALIVAGVIFGPSLVDWVRTQLGGLL